MELVDDDYLAKRLAAMRDHAENPEKYDRMVKFFSRAETKDDLTGASLLYVMDMSFSRADICLALKRIELERGWR